MSAPAPESPPRAVLSRLLRALLDRPVSVAILVFTLVTLGLFSLLRLPVALLPELERPRLEVRLESPGQSAEILAEQVVAPLEKRLLPLPGLAALSARVDDGRALLEVEGEWQADSERLIVEIERLLASQPAGRLASAATRAAPPDVRPVLRLALFAEGATASDLVAITRFADDVLLPELGRLTGAGELRRRGGARRALLVEPRFAALAAHGLTVAGLAERLRGSGRRQGVGEVRRGGERRPLFLQQEIGRLEELEGLAVGEGLALRDLAEVRTADLPDGSLAFFRDREAVLVDLYRAPGANALLLAREARALLGRLAARPPAGIRVELVDDTSGEVAEALGGLGSSLALGLLLGAVVLRLGLGRWRPTLALMVVVPAAIAASFALFFAGGIALDVVSLAGLALASGLLVDSSIVVLEAIASARAAGAAEPRLEGLRQVALPLAASFLTTLMVFLPLFYLEGLARAFFGAQAFAIASSLGLALLLSLTLTPLLCGRGGRTTVGEGGASFGLEVYRGLLASALARPARVAAAALLVLGAAVPLLLSLPKTLMPDGLRRHLGIELELGRGGDDAGRARLSALLAAIAAATDRPFSAELVLPEAGEEPGGRSESRGFRPPFTAEGRGRIEITFASADELEAAAPAIAAACGTAPGIAARIERRRGALAAFADHLGFGLEVEALAATDARASHLAAAAAEALAARGLAADSHRAAGVDRLELRFDPASAPELRAAALREVESLYGGEQLGELRLPGLTGELRLAPPAGGRLELLPVAADSRQERRLLPLAALAGFSPQAGSPWLERSDGRPSRRLELRAGLAQRDEVAAILAAVPRASGERLALTGRSRELEAAFGQLELALGLGLLLVFLCLAAIYESLRLPLAVMAVVPCALAGAFFALAAGGATFDVFSFLGLLVLGGLVVSNGIVLADRAEAWRRSGLPARAAVTAAAAERYRPIVMTTATALLGLLPLALLGGEGAELRRSLALALCGGVAFSWLAVLFVLPLLYVALFRERRA